MSYEQMKCFSVSYMYFVLDSIHSNILMCLINLYYLCYRINCDSYCCYQHNSLTKTKPRFSSYAPKIQPFYADVLNEEQRKVVIINIIGPPPRYTRRNSVCLAKGCLNLIRLQARALNIKITLISFVLLLKMIASLRSVIICWEYIFPPGAGKISFTDRGFFGEGPSAGRHEVRSQKNRGQ